MTEKETRTVSRNHAELALYVAVHRMVTAIHETAKSDLENHDNHDKLEMLLESAEIAGSVALEALTRTGIGSRDEDSPDYKDCYSDWADWITGTGPALRVAEDEEPKAGRQRDAA